MSVWKPNKSPFYQYDFQLRTVRFSGSTGETSRAKAREVERAKRAEARAQVERHGRQAKAPMTLGMAAERYQTEVGDLNAAPRTTLVNLNRLCEFFGQGKRLDQITDGDVAALVTWRRTQTVRSRKTVKDPAAPKKRRAAPTIAPATVNRSTTEVLKKLLSRARKVWKVPLGDEIAWKKHILAEPIERVREVRHVEETLLEKAFRGDYKPVIDFARASGLRMAECLLRKDEVDLIGGRIVTKGKGGKLISKPITTEMRAILMAAMANETDYVFTYVARRPSRDGAEVMRVRGKRYPITASGLKTQWRRAKTAGLPKDLRFHDLRHDFGTKLLRATGNLRLVQKAMGHARIETTLRYAHVLDDEVLAGMEAASRLRRH